MKFDIEMNPLQLLISLSDSILYSLFKDTNHAFRWFLAPYVHLYILGSESLDAYKVQKPIVKNWVNLYNTGTKK